MSDEADEPRSEHDDEAIDRAVILARRKSLLVQSLAGIALGAASSACDQSASGNAEPPPTMTAATAGATSLPCLAYVPPTAVPTVPPTPCLSVPLPSSTPPPIPMACLSPLPCLSRAASVPCLSPPRVPRPPPPRRDAGGPMPCLEYTSMAAEKSFEDVDDERSDSPTRTHENNNEGDPT